MIQDLEQFLKDIALILVRQNDNVWNLPEMNDAYARLKKYVGEYWVEGAVRNFNEAQSKMSSTKVHIKGSPETSSSTLSAESWKERIVAFRGGNQIWKRDEFGHFHVDGKHFKRHNPLTVNEFLNTSFTIETVKSDSGIEWSINDSYLRSTYTYTIIGFKIVSKEEVGSYTKWCYLKHDAENYIVAELRIDDYKEPMYSEIADLPKTKESPKKQPLLEDKKYSKNELIDLLNKIL